MRRLIEAEQARRILSQVEIGFDVITLPLHLSAGRVIAENVFSPINIPPFRRSTRDGFAVLSDDVVGADERNPVVLEVSGKIEAGEFKPLRVESGKAVEVSTGSVMPENADAVVMVENTELRDGVVIVKKSAFPGENVMNEGSDVVAGEVLAREGEIIDTLKIGLLAGAGIGEVKVKDMRIAVISTGNEILVPGQKIEPGKIYDVNGFTLLSELRKLGATPVMGGVVRDDEGEMAEMLNRALNECHAVITSGSTSAGKGDLLYRIVEREGEMVFHGVRVKPGKPFFLGVVDEKPVFGLPGFPTSCLTIFMEFVADVIARNLGYRPVRRTVKGRVARRIFSEGRRELMPVVVVRDMIFPVEKGSGAITSLSESSGYIEIEEGEEIIERNTIREVRLFGKVYDLAVGGLDIHELVELRGEVKRLTSNPKLARLEFMRGNLDAAFFTGGSYSIPYGFFGKKGRTGAVTGYGIEADVYAKSHEHLVSMLRLGMVDGVYMLEPFAERLGIEAEVQGSVEVGFEAVEWIEDKIESHLKRFRK